jgi:hypothetical protein
MRHTVGILSVTLVVGIALGALGDRLLSAQGAWISCHVSPSTRPWVESHT